MMAVKFYENPKVTDDIEIDFYTPDADGCFNADPCRIDNVKIYFIVRDLNGAKDSQNLVDQFSIEKQREYLEAQQLACEYPNDAEIVATAEQLKREFFASSIFNSTYYTVSNVVYNIGDSNNPAWVDPTIINPNDNANSPITKVTDDQQIQFGHFKFIWSPNGSIREGDYYVCWTWSPSCVGESYSSYQHFYVSTNIANEVTNPSHIINSSQYKTLLDSYLPEMYKLSYAKDDYTVQTMESLNASVAEGFTVLDNLGTQLQDITDANATQEPILGYLAGFFGMPLRSSDVTLWRRQIKDAIPNLKKKGTLEGLTEALANAGIGLTKFTQFWQCGTDNVYTETFEYTGSLTFELFYVSLDPTNILYTPYFSLEKRSATGSYTDLTSFLNTYLTFSTVGGVTTITWIGPSLTVGDFIKLTYQIKPFGMGELAIYNIVMSLPLADQRDDKDFTYPPKDWNTRLISEDDSNFSTVISQKNPFVDYLYFGKVRTKFPYSENVYNMDEYNGSLRDSQNPCDIDKMFIEPCRGGISPYYMLDVELGDLSDDRITECKQIVAEFTPFHAILHTLNFTGRFEDFILPPVEQVNALVQYKINEFMIAGMAQVVFNRAMYLGLDANMVLRDQLATQIGSVQTATTDAYNKKIMLFCPEVNFATVGLIDDPARNLLEILTGTNANEYAILSVDGYYAELSPTTPASESPSLDTAPFTFNLSNITLQDPNFTAAQANSYSLRDSTENLLDYSIKTVWDVNNGYAGTAWQIQLPIGTYDILDFRDSIIYIDDSGAFSNVDVTGVTYTLLDETATPVLTSSTGDYRVKVLGKITVSTLYDVKEYISDGGYFYYDATSDQYPFYSYVEGDLFSFLISDWDGVNGTVAGKTLMRLVDGQVGNFGYRGMKLLWNSPLPVFDDPNTPGIADDQNFTWNYLIMYNSQPYCITDVETVGLDTYVTIDGVLQSFGYAAPSSISIDVYRYGKESIMLFGETLIDVSRNGQDVFDALIQMPFAPTYMDNPDANKPNANDNINQTESISIKIEYADGRIETGEIK